MSMGVLIHKNQTIKVFDNFFQGSTIFISIFIGVDRNGTVQIIRAQV
jgi:hypothetical protein